MSDVPCAVADCTNPARRAGLCWGHVQRRSRGQRVEGLLRERPDGAWARLVEAAVTLAELEATDDAGWLRARDNLRKAAAAYARQLPSFQGPCGRCPREAAASAGWERPPQS